MRAIRPHTAEPSNHGTAVSPHAARVPILEHRGPARLALLAVMLLAVATRCYLLDDEPLWEDEGATLRFALQPLSQLWGPGAVGETNPPLYYTLQHFWLVFGQTEAALRSLSVVISLIGVVLTYLFARQLASPDVSRRVGLLAAALMAVSTAQVEYAQEARAYSLMSTAGALVLLCLASLFRDADAAARPLIPWKRRPEPAEKASPAAWPAWLGFTLGSMVVLYSHNTAVVLIFLVHAIAFAWWLTAGGRCVGFFINWVACNLLVLLAWSWWVPKIFHQTNTRLVDWWMPEPSWHIMRRALQKLYLYPWIGWQGQVGLVLLLVAAAGAVWGMRRKPWALCLSAGVGFGGFLLLFGLSFWRPMFIPRALVWTTAPVIVFIAIGVMQLRPLMLRAFVVASLLALGGKHLTAWHHYESKEPIDRVAAYLRAHESPEDLVAFAWAHKESAFGYYYDYRLPGTPRVVGLVGWPRAEFDAAAYYQPYMVLDLVPYDELPGIAAGHPRVWVVCMSAEARLPGVVRSVGPLIDRQVFGPVTLLAFDTDPTDNR